MKVWKMMQRLATTCIFIFWAETEELMQTGLTFQRSRLVSLKIFRAMQIFWIFSVSHPMHQKIVLIGASRENIFVNNTENNVEHMSSWDILSDFRRLMIQQEPDHLNKRLNEMRAATVFFDTKLVLAAWWWWWWWNQFEWRVAVECIVSVTARSELTMANCYPAQLSSARWAHQTWLPQADHTPLSTLPTDNCIQHNASLSSAQLSSETVNIVWILNKTRTLLIIQEIRRNYLTNDTLTLGTFTLSDAYLITLLLQHILVANQTLQFNGWQSVNIIVYRVFSTIIILWPGTSMTMHFVQ